MHSLETEDQGYLISVSNTNGREQRPRQASLSGTQQQAQIEMQVKKHFKSKGTYYLAGL